VISVVVPCHDEREHLPELLDALTGQVDAREFEVVVVDNGSSDGSAALAWSYADRLKIRVEQAEGPLAVSEARNAGAARAQGDLLVFLDADDVPSPRYLAAMEAALEHHEFVAARMEDALINPPWLVGSRPLYQKHGLNDVFGFLPWAFGGTLGIRRALFERIGGFPVVGRYGDDVDLCWRVQLAGTPLRFVPDAVVHYRLRRRLGETWRQAVRYGRSSVGYYSRFSSEGMPRASFRQVFLGLLLAPRLPLAWTRRARFRWVYDAGLAWGRVRGSLAEGVLYPLPGGGWPLRRASRTTSR
jgi:GT2 family glycosyltransferase